MIKKVYCASPLGFSESGRAFLNSKIYPSFEKADLHMVDPWELTDNEYISSILNMPYGEERIRELKKMNGIIAENNANAIKSSDGLFAVLDGTDIDSGTASEIGYAFALGKKITAYRGDFRICGDNDGTLVNLQVDYFIRQGGGQIIEYIENLTDELKRVFNA